MKYEGILFDLDGVICHTDKYHYLAWKKIADDYGIYFDEAINSRLRGVSRMKSLDIILESYDSAMTVEEKRKAAEKKNDYYKLLLNELTPSDLSLDVKSTIELFKAEGVKQAIASSSKNAEFILKRLGLTGFFDAVIDGNKIKYSKPNPEVFSKAAEALNLPPERCLVVEDAQAGVEGAIAAAIDCAGIGDAIDPGTVTYMLKRIADLVEIVL